MAADKKTVENGSGRDSGGRFAPGCTGGPGRPKGSANAILTQARQWVESKGLPMLIQAAENGDTDALRALVVMAMPKAKPVAAPLEGLTDMPLPEVRRDMGALAGYLLEAVAAGRIALDDAERLLALAKKAIDLKQLGRPFCVDDFRI